MRGLLGIAALSLTVVAGPIWAAGMGGMDPTRDPMVFKQLDRDQNGMVSRAEAQSMTGLVQGFDIADRDRDGQLNPAELATALPQSGGE